MEEGRNHEHLVEAIRWVVREEMEKRDEKLRADMRIEFRQLRELLEKYFNGRRPQTLQAFFVQNPGLGVILGFAIVILASLAGVDIGKLWR